MENAHNRLLHGHTRCVRQLISQRLQLIRQTRSVREGELISYSSGVEFIQDHRENKKASDVVCKLFTFYS